MKILVADDFVASRRLIVAALRSGGIPSEIHEVTNGMDAAEALRNESFDCAFIDFRMPGKDGLEVLREARALGNMMPIIVTTGEGDENTAVAAMKLGATDYLPKAQLTVEHVRQSLRYAIRIADADRRAKDAEEERRRSAELLETLIRTAPLSIIVFDLEAKVRLWNAGAERLFGWTSEEVLGNSMPLFAPGEYAQFLAYFEQAKRGHAVEGVEARRTCKNGTIIDLCMYYALLRDRDGHITGLTGIATDMTESNRMKEQLLHSQRMESIGRLAGGVAHDFNNLLAIISGYSEGLLRRLDPGSPLREHALQIEKAAERGSGLTHQLLAFSRGQAIEPRAMDLNDIVTSVHQMLSHTISEEIHIHLKMSDSLEPIKADPGQIEQVLMNLAINARDAMPHGGDLTIETAMVFRPGQIGLDHGLPRTLFVQLSVTDTGRGMDEKIRAHLFEPFFTTKEREGTGLGLWIVYGIVERCGGSISVRSKVGEGSTFDLFFPVARPIDS